MASTTRTGQVVPVTTPIQEGATTVSGSSTLPDGSRFPLVALFDENNPDRKISPSGSDVTQPVSVQGTATVSGSVSVSGTAAVAVQGSSSFVGGGTQTATTTPGALNGGTSLSCTEVYVQNDPGSVYNLYVGYNGAQPLVITPGSGTSLQISNVNLVYVKTSSGTATVNWLARA